MGNLIERHAEAGIELRITPDIWPFWHLVVFSALNFSASRLRCATPSFPNPSAAPPLARTILTVHINQA